MFIIRILLNKMIATNISGVKYPVIYWHLYLKTYVKPYVKLQLRVYLNNLCYTQIYYDLNEYFIQSNQFLRQYQVLIVVEITPSGLVKVSFTQSFPHVWNTSLSKPARPPDAILPHIRPCQMYRSSQAFKVDKTNTGSAKFIAT